MGTQKYDLSVTPMLVMQFSAILVNGTVAGLFSIPLFHHFSVVSLIVVLLNVAVVVFASYQVPHLWRVWRLQRAGDPYPWLTERRMRDKRYDADMRRMETATKVWLGLVHPDELDDTHGHEE